MLYRLIALETDLAKEVKAEKSEHYYPYSKIYFSVEDTPVVSLVSDAEELQTKGDLYKAEYYLY